MLIPKLVDNSASSNVQPPIFWYVVCIHEMQLLARWTPKSELSVIGSFLWPKSATKMILITLLTKSTQPNEIICINDHSEVWISHFCHGNPASSDLVIGLETVKYRYTEPCATYGSLKHYDFTKSLIWNLKILAWYSPRKNFKSPLRL